MGEAGRRFNFAELERHCDCKICMGIREARALQEQQAALYQLSQGDSVGDKNHSSEV